MSMLRKIPLTQMCFFVKCMCTRLCVHACVWECVCAELCDGICMHGCVRVELCDGMCMHGCVRVCVRLSVCVYCREAIVVLQSLHHSIQYICPSPNVSQLSPITWCSCSPITERRALLTYLVESGTACILEIISLHELSNLGNNFGKNLVRGQIKFREMKQTCKR